MKPEEALVYLNGGDICLHMLSKRPFSKWRVFCLDKGQKYMYMGVRYWYNKCEEVIVFDTKKWDKKEIERRTRNGFENICKYKL